MEKIPEHLETKPFAKGVITNGYFGDTINTIFYFLEKNGKTIVEYNDGFFTYQTPSTIDVKEALWMIKNHPLSDAQMIKEL